MHLPNFMLIGAQKAGTSALMAALGQHPQVFTSKPKEPMYYCVRDWPEGPRLILNSIATPQQYLALFEGAGDRSAIGEASTMYLPCPWVPNRLRTELPELKLIAILRQPVDRAFSHYLMHVRDGKRSLATIQTDIWSVEKRRFGQQVWDFGYVPVGLYAQQIERYLELFPKPQLHVCLYEDYCARPREVARGIFRFLGVNDGFEPDVSRRLNEASVRVPRATLGGRLFHPGSAISRAARAVLPAAGRTRQTYEAYSQGMLAKPALPADLHRQLQERFSEDIVRLAQLIDRDLSHWLDRKP